MDRGAEAARHFVHATLAGPMADVVGAPPAPDAKTELQIRLQAAGRGLPTYRDVADYGPDHEKRFVTEVVVGDEALGRGEGPTKRMAQAAAATAALGTL